MSHLNYINNKIYTSNKLKKKIEVWKKEVLSNDFINLEHWTNIISNGKKLNYEMARKKAEEMGPELFAQHRNTNHNRQYSSWFICKS